MSDNNQEETGSNSAGTVLVVEDNENLNHLICKTLQREGYKTDSAFTGEEAIEKISLNPDRIVLLDYKLRNMNAMDVMKAVSLRGITGRYIIMTGFIEQSLTPEMQRLGAIDYLYKEGAFLDRVPECLRKTETKYA